MTVSQILAWWVVMSVPTALVLGRGIREGMRDE